MTESVGVAVVAETGAAGSMGCAVGVLLTPKGGAGRRVPGERGSSRAIAGVISGVIPGVNLWQSVVISGVN